jgi:hypothetical protein
MPTTALTGYCSSASVLLLSHQCAYSIQSGFPTSVRFSD